MRYLIILLALLIPIEVQSKTKKNRTKRTKSRWAALTSVSFPYPYQIGFGKVRRKGVSHFIEMGTFDFNIGSRGRVRNLKGNLAHIEYKNRFVPFKKHPFYCEYGGGIQKFDITGERTVTLTSEGVSYPIDVQADLNIYSIYLNPKVGFTWYHRQGWFTGFGFGYNIPIYSQAGFSGTFTEDKFINQALVQTEGYSSFKSEIERLGTKAGKLGLPYLQILEIGYLF